MKNKPFKLPALSVFFPAYNEAGNIEESVLQALQVLPSVAEKFEVIVVNDGSKDATLAIARRLARTHKTVRVASQTNKGYGGALKLGFARAKYSWIFFTDSDLQFDISELKKLVKYSHSQKLVIGYRINRAEGFKRNLLATLLKVWNQIMLGFPKDIKDIDCAFKLIKKSVLKEIEPLFSDGAIISTELLLKAHRAGYTFKQVGVHHYHRLHGESTGDNPNVLLKALRDSVLLTLEIYAHNAVYLLQSTRLAMVNRLKSINPTGVSLLAKSSYTK